MSHPTGISFQPRSKEPRFRQIFDQIASRVRDGTFPPGYRLPPTRSLAGELSAHRNTVVRAYQELEAAGFVTSTVGRGTFVAEHLRASAVQPTAPSPEQRLGLPWTSLASDAVAVEPLARSDRLVRHASPAGAINLGKMQPSADLLPGELLRRCIDHVLRSKRGRALGYAPREGLPRLREIIARDLQSQGVPASAEDLIITTGSQQALDLIARALINPGDAFLADEATYAGALHLLALAGARLIGIPSDDEGPQLDVLERNRGSGAKGLYLMPNCQNPTGSRISSERRLALVSWSHQAGIPLIEDDYASELNLDGRTPPPALRALDGEVIYLGTYSKKLIPALRIGYLLCPRALRAHFAALKHALDLGTSALLQHALAEFLERGYLRAHLGRVLAEYRKRRDALELGLSKHLPKGVRWSHPQTGLGVWLPTPPSIDPEELFREAQLQGVLISPGTLNGVSPTQRRGVRLLFCSEPAARLAEAARRLGRAWVAVERRSRPTIPVRVETRLEAV
ncbi:MAG TPA: PLP-dependent aminotransferase family protein [Myxococcaceae bacterium]|nr:PLP-dependent aminotransferase family protein [Myxococcaceae bacterium]